MEREIMVRVLKELTLQAEVHTLNDNTFTENRARQLLAGINLLNGREEEAATAWLAAQETE